METSAWSTGLEVDPAKNKGSKKIDAHSPGQSAPMDRGQLLEQACSSCRFLQNNNIFKIQLKNNKILMDKLVQPKAEKGSMRILFKAD
jgi:hypothetical protein